MIHFQLNGMKMTAPADRTILAAARQAGIDIPVLCTFGGVEPAPSCMVCVVEDTASGRLWPACGTKLQEGMSIVTNSERVQQARRTALEWLLAEHEGECQAPCQRTCPLQPDLPDLLRRAGNGDEAGAWQLAREQLILPRVLAGICGAPCEGACRRKKVDAPVRIRDLISRLANHATAGDADKFPVPGFGAPRVAVAGAGPAGLAAAYELLRRGYRCLLLDDHPLPGGALRYGSIDSGKLSKAGLEADLAFLASPGLEWRGDTTLGRDISLAELQRDCAAVVLATGPKALPADNLENTRLPERVVIANGGLRTRHVCVRSLAAGRRAARRVAELTGFSPEQAEASTFNFSRPLPVEELVRRQAVSRPAPVGSSFGEDGHGAPEFLSVRAESRRCLECGCAKHAGCRLRQLAERSGINPRSAAQVPPPGRLPVAGHPRLVFTPGLCIRCGLCVRISRSAGEPVGLAMLGRGWDLQVGVPFGGSLSEALTRSARTCAEACPSGALVWREEAVGGEGRMGLEVTLQSRTGRNGESA